MGVWKLITPAADIGFIIIIFDLWYALYVWRDSELKNQQIKQLKHLKYI